MILEATAQFSDLCSALATRGPAEARPYVEMIAGAAVSRPSPLITPERLAWVVAGLGLRETVWGTTHDLDQPGPGGTGDFGARHRRPDPDLFYVSPVHQGVANLPDEHGRVWVLPVSRRGWGLGLMQWDWEKQNERARRTLPDGSPAWADPRVNIEEGTAIFLETLADLGQERQAIAGYNCGPAGVRAALSAGQNIDANTEGGNYSRWVLEKLQEWGAPSDARSGS